MKKLFLTGLLGIIFLLHAQAAKHIITASGTSFSPNNIPNVIVGDTIRWEWVNNSHTTTSVSVPPGAATWDNPLNSGSPSFEYPVTVAGTYNYKCIPHESFGMTGTFTAIVPAAKHVILATALIFSPDVVAGVEVGDTIRWEWVDGFHTTTSKTIPTGAATWDAPLTDTDLSYEYVVAVPGVYRYVCTPHESMGMVGVFATTGSITSLCDTLTCNDQDACTNDACDSTSGCVFTAVDCDDHDACTTETCDSLSGCQYTPLNCNDASACTNDTCTAALGCQNTLINCDDSDLCTNDQCDSLAGCINVPINCDDADLCTIDNCANGVCANTTFCDDGDICTTDGCLLGNCTVVQIPGCNNPCDTMTCDDADLCTTDTCSNAACVFTAITCDDGDACTSDSCVSGNCVFTAIVCDDGDACTTDTCNGNCIFTAIICDDNDSCTANACVNGVCQFTPVVCDDSDTCTVDACSGGVCTFTPIPGCADPCEILVCNDNDACTTDTCTNANCLFTDIICDDGDSCTTDACANGTCTYLQIPGCPVGVHELSSADLRVYPNPAQDVVTVELLNSSLTRVIITDITGKQLYDSEAINTMQHTMQLRELPGGVYLLHIKSDAGEGVRKLQVEK